MDSLRKILYALIIVLVVIVAGGGGYLALNGGHLGNHGKTQQTAQAPDKTQKTGETPASSAQQNQSTTQQSQSTSQQPQQTGQNQAANQQTQTPNQQPQTSGQQPPAPVANGQQPAPIPYPAAPPVRLVDPDPYYDRLNKAQEVIEDANKMITVDPFANSGKDPAANGADMSKLHQGIYKMSQGMTIMEETLDTLNQDIKGTAKFGSNPGQQAYQGYNPYQGYNQQNLPYGYNQQYPYNQPGYSNQQQPNQTQPNQNLNQTDPNAALHQASGGQSHGTGAAGILGNVSAKKLLTTVAYGILIASIVGVFVAILGMVNSMFRKPGGSQS